ncbi:pantetheine-phosphate adenylyltransferase [Cochleicola gelatinilyticus]|uniref:Phosphopantetheine adenylyltransferase n=1 Tax=Cochleicola gelatinilyticus TaxID=1763537 RepID=A0A167KC52_9FLAO|nr:pantetheine-phosphate adenylyltransferase [Cochleicola gelatinilyticus]OAB81712.1 phosphopantetheine adenylyltransferase [Cochleicola gelatinilyticus]
MKRAVFPGSFDPITLGHVDIIERGLKIFDEIIIAIGINAEKKYMWSLEDRKKTIEAIFEGNKKIKVKTYEGLTSEFCKKEEANCILRGVRNTSDFTYEQTIAQANAEVNGVDSFFLISSPKFSYVSSSIVRDLARNGGDYSLLVPKDVTN